MKVLVPAAGVSQRFRDKGILTPKPLITFQYQWSSRMTMLEHAVAGIDAPVAVGMNADADWPDVGQYVLVKDTQGQADTIHQMLTSNDLGVDFGEEVLIINSDQKFFFSLDTFAKQARGFDKAALVFEDTHTWDGFSPYSYVDNFPDFRLTAEKVQISPWAIAGAFYFKSAAFLMEALDNQKRFNVRAPNNEFYLSATLQCAGGGGLAVLCKKDQVVSWGTPEELFGDPNVHHVSMEME